MILVAFACDGHALAWITGPLDHFEWNVQIVGGKFSEAIHGGMTYFCLFGGDAFPDFSRVCMHDDDLFNGILFGTTIVTGWLEEEDLRWKPCALS